MIRSHLLPIFVLLIWLLAALCAANAGALKTAYLDTGIFPAASLSYNFEEYPTWTNATGQTAYIKGTWIFNGCSGEPFFFADVWARLQIEGGSENVLVEAYGWDRYAQPSQASESHAMFGADYFEVPAGYSVVLECGAQGYPYLDGNNARFQAVIYYTTGTP